MTYGKLLSNIWTNHDFNALNSQEQQLYMLLLSYPTRNHAGVLPLTLRRWARATAEATPDNVRTALMHLSEARFVVLDWDTEEVLVRTYIKNDQVYRQPKVMKCALREALEIASPILRSALSEELCSLPKHTDEQGTVETVKLLVETPDEGYRQGYTQEYRDGYDDSQGVGSYVSGVRNAPTPEHPTPEHPATEHPATEHPAAAPSRRANPSMDLTTIATGHPPAPPEPPPPDYGPSYADAMDMVATIVGRQHPGTTRGLLTREATKLLDEGIPCDVVQDALRLWMTKKLHASQLPALVSDVLKERNGHTRQLSTSERNFLKTQSLKENYPPATLKELM